MADPIRIRFLSRNPHKLREAQEILGKVGVAVDPVNATIEELQTDNTVRLVRDKVLRAFERVGRALFVEHTGLYVTALNGFPGGLTQVFWDTLGAEKFADLLGKGADPSVIAKTVVGYCDGQTIELFQGEVRGLIADSPRGSRDFQWDCVFIPDGFTQTFAELGPKKHDISMRRKALDSFATALKARRTGGTAH
jgi:XTP/dITP diphosphohydrolase